MPTESKKLQTTFERHPIASSFPPGVDQYFIASVNDPIVMGLRSVASREELKHDARIAHEQREVIRQLVDALEWEIECSTRDKKLHGVARDALAAAAPFLED